jgi:hypothetical protein
MRRGDDGFGSMSRSEADFVRSLRVERGMTWRSVADECAFAWDGDWDADQATGREICECAAALLGDDPNKDPWN